MHLGLSPAGAKRAPAFYNLLLTRGKQVFTESTGPIFRCFYQPGPFNRASFGSYKSQESYDESCPIRQVNRCLTSVGTPTMIAELISRSGEIGIRTRLKIWRGSLLMSVRVRPPAPPPSRK